MKNRNKELFEPINIPNIGEKFKIVLSLFLRSKEGLLPAGAWTPNFCQDASFSKTYHMCENELIRNSRFIRIDFFVIFLSLVPPATSRYSGVTKLTLDLNLRTPQIIRIHFIIKNYDRTYLFSKFNMKNNFIWEKTLHFVHISKGSQMVVFRPISPRFRSIILF